MKKLKDIELKGKKVLIRCDFNVAMEDGEIVEEIRIEKSLNTIKHALERGAEKVVLVSHLGRPKGQRLPELSLEPIREKLKEFLEMEIGLLDNLDNLDNFLRQNSHNRLALLENIRYWEEEKANNPAFAEKIAGNFDVYVNDAFSASHRAHASIAGFPQHSREKAAGLLFEKEFEELSWAKDNPEKPAAAVIGGAKIDTKLPVIRSLEENYDQVLVGGKVANEALDGKLEFSENVYFPEDFSPADKKEQRLDIGKKTVDVYIEKISKARSIIWNGPMGKFEDDDCQFGTKEIINAIIENTNAYTIIGGGETLEAVNRFSSLDHFDYVSMSGGAMLEFLGGKELPGIEALK
ncbi:MAG: phosphoglycerate kinase [Candidatus Moranbacteria bacterium]|nr:phosphoglycerate kinase [Candidatus Moranbacteria bacterium]